MYTYYSVLNKSTMQGKFNTRLKMVEYALVEGVKPAARLFKVTPKTVRKWRDRYKAQGINGLLDASKAPHNQWKKCSRKFEAKVIRLRRKTKNKFGALRLKQRHGLERSPTCINRIIQQRPRLRRKKKTRHEKRNELRAVKRLTKAFDLIQVDVKELMDISNYYVQQWKCKTLPKYEITARDVKTGATWVCLADKKTTQNTTCFMAMLLEHFQTYGFDVKCITIQTDNGVEFHNKAGQVLSSFDQVLERYQVQQNRIPAAAPTFNSDVETFHRLVEDEFYSIEQFSDVEDMQKQLYTYMLDFNYLRTNSYKENKTPYQLLKEDYPDLNPNILNFPAVKIDNYFGYYASLFSEETETVPYDPEEYFLFHDIDPHDLPGGYHVSSFHINRTLRNIPE